MTEIYVMHFKCCDSELDLGLTADTGKHGDYCLVCDAEDPDTEVYIRE